MLQLGILASGTLGYKILLYLYSRYNIVFILTDSKSEEIKRFANDNNIKVFVGNPRKHKGCEFIKDTNVDIIISINYLFIIESDIINHARLLSFNIHGSLLPKYRGRTPHVWAIINNEKETGITAHRIEEGCDTGAIIEQVKIPILKHDTGNDILLKFQKEYPMLITKVLNSIEKGTLKFKPQDNNKATFFGKRSPHDGQINWGWQKERIFNWVRAQAYPYPGAFTFYKGRKIIIDKVSFSDYGFNFSDDNGIILKSGQELLLKTPNGALRMEKIRNFSEIDIDFVTGEKFMYNENK